MRHLLKLARALSLLTALTVIGLGADALAAPKNRKAPECPRAAVTAADRQLWLGPADKQASIATHLPWGTPRQSAGATGEHLLVQRDYVIDYDDDLRDPIWTAHRLVFGQLDPKHVKRANCFRRDVRLPSVVAASKVDYDEPIFDQGHMTPNSDMTTSRIAVMNSFIMSNMTPQFCQFNEGVWQELEDLTRRWARAHGAVYVITGAVFDRDDDGQRDADDAAFHMQSKNGARRVAIPSAYYKIIAYQEPGGGPSTITLLLPHDQANWTGDEAVAYLGRHLATIADIEKVTGLTFFPSNSAARTEASALWAFDGRAPKSLGLGDRCQGTSGAVIH